MGPKPQSEQWMTVCAGCGPLCSVRVHWVALLRKVEGGKREAQEMGKRPTPMVTARAARGLKVTEADYLRLLEPSHFGRLFPETNALDAIGCLARSSKCRIFTPTSHECLRAAHQKHTPATRGSWRPALDQSLGYRMPRDETCEPTIFG